MTALIDLLHKIEMNVLDEVMDGLDKNLISSLHE